MKYFFLIGILFISFSGEAQTEEESTLPKKHRRGKPIQAGLYLGSLFANKYTASIYDGYGYDLDGHKNDFLNSFMYRKIYIEYGGGNGQPDQIAQQLNVNPGEWAFDQTDMPVNMKYNPAFLIGFQGRFETSRTTAILLNVNAAKLTLNGNFTLQLLTAPIGPVQPNFQNLQVCSIMGTEQRIVFQAGLQHIFGKDEVFGLILEGGPVMTMVKFVDNSIIINELHINLMTFYDQYGYEIYKAKNLTGIGFGAFAGMGINVKTESRWILQAVYHPSVEKVPLGEYQSPKIQHSLGMRAYYEL